MILVIGVDAGSLSNELNTGGIYTITVNLLKGLGKIDKRNNYLLYSFNPINKKLIHEFGENFKNIVVKPSKGWNKIWLPMRFIKEHPDVYLALSQALPSYHPFKSIGFIHGLDLETNSYEDRKKLQKLSSRTNDCIQEADILVTVSKYLREVVKEKYNKDSMVIYPGVSNIFNREVKIYKNDFPYFLFVGTYKNSKNIHTILISFAKFLTKSKNIYNLYLIGDKADQGEKIELLIKKLNIEARVIQRKIENDSLPEYFRGATAFVSPSIHESFGLPFLEAMATGCPVIGSNRGGIPEVVGDAGILLEPDDVEGISKAMLEVSSDKMLREKMIKKGLERSKKFTWEKFAGEVYQEIVKLGDNR